MFEFDDFTIVFIFKSISFIGNCIIWFWSISKKGSLKKDRETVKNMITTSVIMFIENEKQHSQLQKEIN